jgi:nucleotide-binding universal stress UspA family protein
MHSIKTILFATDLRPASQEAAKAVARLASGFGANVHILHAIEPLPNWSMESQQQEKREPLNQLAAEMASLQAHVSEPRIEMGPPASTILRIARELDVDLIVLGAGDRTGLFRIAGGPTALAVMEHAAAPVLAVRPGPPPLSFKKILCPVDQSRTSAQGLRNAIRLARTLGSELVILTVVPDVSYLIAAAETGKLANAKLEFEAKWRAEFERFVAAIPTHEVKTTTELRFGKAHEQIVAVAQELQADLLVMGATGHTGLARMLLGSTTRRVLEQLPTSLLVVKDQDLLGEEFDADVRLLRVLMAEGRDLAAAGSYEAAVAKFRQVLRHNPFHVAAITALAEVHEKLGQHDQARHYRSCLQTLQSG